MQKETNLEKIVRVLKKHVGQKLTVQDIAKEAGLKWHKVYRAITDLIIIKVAQQQFRVDDGISIVPEITTEGLFFRPQLAEEVA